MATAYAQPSSALQSPREHFLQPNPPPQPRKHASRQRFAAEFSQCLYDFVIQLLPTSEELAVKEDVRKLLERLIRTIEPDSRLLSFGSTANGFSLRNSGMRLVSFMRTHVSSQRARHGPLLSDRLRGASLRHRLGEHGWGSTGARYVVPSVYPRLCIRILAQKLSFMSNPYPTLAYRS